jgi:AcrR family transcriptional regulator
MIASYEMIISNTGVASMGLREEKRQLTRRAILDAVLDLVAEGSIEAISVPAVSRRSRVAVATIYRYFPTKDALLTAAAAEPAARAVDADALSREPADRLPSFHRAMWHDFAGNLPLVRHQVASDAGRAMRDARLADSQRELARYVEHRGVDPASPDGQRLVSLLLLLLGSLGFLELHDRQGLDVDEAVARSVWAMNALIEATVGEET